MGMTQYIALDEAGAGYRLLDSINPPHVLTQPMVNQPFEVIYSVTALNGVRIRAIHFDGQRILAYDARGTPHVYVISTDTLAPLNQGASF